MKKSPFRSVRLGWHRLLNARVVRIDGVRVHAGADFVPRNVQTALFKGTFEAAERHLLKLALRPGHRVLDVGAATGLTSLVASRIVSAERVLSYEPNPAMRRVFEANFRLNGLEPNLRAKALSADGRSVAFFQEADVVGSSTFDKGAGAAPTQVESDAIGAVVEAHRPHVIVMDAEGMEAELLTAAPLDGVECLVVEFHPQIIGTERVEALAAHLAQAGFGAAPESVGRVALFARNP